MFKNEYEAESHYNSLTIDPRELKNNNHYIFEEANGNKHFGMVVFDSDGVHVEINEIMINDSSWYDLNCFVKYYELKDFK